MAANRRNARSDPVEANPPLDTPTFVAAMNSMATAMRDSTAAMRESAAATHRAMEQLERQNRNNGEAEHTWAEFRTEFYKKYFSPSARAAKELELLQLKQGNMTVAEYTPRTGRRDQPSRNFNRNLAPQG
ncbi:hypothetical protein PIB30_105450 [Stylosanthes scabra]|uniref:Retrotransposon gag domain-containing protein n=1 Tax=Stylosanthes scabra TaxID=79078 RepID=A0ABU6W0E3_9FABA|nr:hypothetical protein [Stylosanthes scabra]